MKLKKNQIMITALAIMIAIAGYLNFAGSQMKEETLVVTDEVISEDEMAALLDLSEEDILSDIDTGNEDTMLSDAEKEEEMLTSEIESLDEEAVLTSNYLTDEEVVVDVSSNEEEAMDEIMEGTPGEAVFTSTQAVSTLSAAKVLKEQTRAKKQAHRFADCDSVGFVFTAALL